ncbi:unnamed protein product, partial [marine sediment metagenome]
MSLDQMRLVFDTILSYYTERKDEKRIRSNLDKFEYITEKV